MGEKITSKTFIAVLVLIIAISVWVGNFSFFFNFDEHYWFEETLHFLGGVWIATVFLYYFQLRSNLFDVNENLWLSLFFGVSATALIGVLWEFLEYLVVWRVGGTVLTLEDTLLDILLDMAGGAAFVLLSYFSDKKLKK